ncbi:MAG: tetratricopeptide repeat protein [Pseudomonadota bacterium]|nr:tetratricopeptide repeat protein [Pseudomonadota bacterium]
MAPVMVLIVVCWIFLPRAALGTTSSIDPYQRQLSPAANRLLVNVQSLVAKKEERKALAKIEKFRQDHPRSAYLLVEFMAGNLQFSLEQLKSAVASYRRAIELAPKFLPAQENLGMTLLSLKEYRQAGEQFAAAVSLARKTDSTRLDILLKYAGTSYLMVADYGRAQPFFSELVEKRQDFGRESVQTLVRIYLELQRNKAAERLLSLVLHRFPEDADYWCLLGQVRLTTGNYASALAAYKVMLSFKKPEVKDFKIIVQLYRLLGLPSAAGQALEQLYQLQQSSLTVDELGELVALYLQAGDDDRALDWLKRKQSLYPSGRNLLQQGEILYRAGRYKEAYGILSGLTLLSEKQGYQFLLAGYCAWYADDLSAARSAFKRASKYERYRERSIALISGMLK